VVIEVAEGQLALPCQHHREKDGATVSDVIEWGRIIPWGTGRARPGYVGNSVGDPDPEPDPDPHVFGPPDPALDPSLFWPAAG
jgi:hypothetical protein